MHGPVQDAAAASPTSSAAPTPRRRKLRYFHAYESHGSGHLPVQQPRSNKRELIAGTGGGQQRERVLLHREITAFDLDDHLPGAHAVANQVLGEAATQTLHQRREDLHVAAVPQCTCNSMSHTAAAHMARKSTHALANMICGRPLFPAARAESAQSRRTRRFE
jgi:hypothetical protein